MWYGVGKTNHNDESYIKPVMFVFLQTDSFRIVRFLATASGDVNRSVLVAHGWPVNDMDGGVLQQGKRFRELRSIP